MSEKVLTCDTIVIGAGSAGIEAYKAATGAGANCILIESGPLGTSAKRTGDTPLSALSFAGKISRARWDLEKYGIKTALDYGIDTENVLNSVRAVRGKETSEILSFIYRIPEDHRLIGKASFIDANTVQVSDSTQVKFKTAVIAPGTVPLIPFELNQYMKNGGVYTISEIFELDHLPNSMAVFGSSGEGLIIGQALAYLGVKVVVFGDHNLWELTDEAVIDTAIDLFKERFDLVLDSCTTAFECNEFGYCIYYMDNSQYENFLNVDTVFAAGARFAKIEGLNLRELGINLSRQGEILVDEKTMQTSIPHIFAAGDATNLHMTTAQAKRSGLLAGKNAALFPECTTVSKDVHLNILFTDPEVAMVGLSYEQVKQRAKQGQPFVSSEVRTTEGRYRTTRHEGGILRLYCDEATHEILGAEMCMYRASHLAQYLSLVISQKMRVEDVCELSFFNLSYEEVIQQACQIAKRTLDRRQLGRAAG